MVVHLLIKYLHNIYLILEINIFNVLHIPLLYADTLVYPTESLKHKESCILNEVFKAGHQKEVIHKNLLRHNIFSDMDRAMGGNQDYMDYLQASISFKWLCASKMQNPKLKMNSIW